MKLLGIDLFCGLGGWTEGFLSEGFEMIGFDIERHVYGQHQYPAQLVLQDVRTLHGSQFKDAAIIVASSPCQKYSYMAMPWTRAKEQAKWYRDPLYPERLIELNELFEQPKRIQREASEAAGRHIPLVQENVRGAIPWVGRSQWHYGSYYLWGDVPALMPITHRGVKVSGMNWSGSDKPGYKAVAFNDPRHTAKSTGWFGDHKDHPMRQGTSKGLARKAASARIAKIPFPLAEWIARVTREARKVA